MINPIQQNVVFFKGVDKVQSQDKFTGNMPIAQSVRGDYASTVDNVSKMQQSMNNVASSVGNNLNTIA